MTRIINALAQFFCPHGTTARKWDRRTGRFYLECLRCQHQSPGIYTAVRQQSPEPVYYGA